MPLGTEVNLGPGDVVLMGSQIPPKRGTAPQFSVYVYCNQTAAGWVKMPLGTEVDLGPGRIVLDGDPAPLEMGRAAPPPLFGPCLLLPRSSISATADAVVKLLAVCLISLIL